jgi:hypothetical protein
MVNLVFYDEEGNITSSAQMTLIVAELMKTPYLVVDDFRPDYDATHKVIKGKLVAK